VLTWLGMVLAAGWVLLQTQRGVIKSPFMPTPTPTRMAGSYQLEAETHFAVGKLDDPNSANDAIDTYKLATLVDPGNAELWAELARLQTYSSALLSTDAEQTARLQEALASAQKAVELAPENSTVQAIYAFVLDWNATGSLISADQRQAYLNEAELAARRALGLDPENALALAFYAEVLVDQQKWTQAAQYAKQAVERAPDSMDTHRVYATVLEHLGAYRDAIQEYIEASKLAPNLTFLYINIGVGYRNLRAYDTALEYFDRAARVNEQLGIRDPFPYIAIAKTYTQQGEAMSASLNAEKALSFDPADPDTYGQLGMIYVQAKNYEAALLMLQCAVEGCTTWWRMPPADKAVQATLRCAEDGCTPLICEQEGCSDKEKVVAERWFGPDYTILPITVDPLALTNLDVAYYYIRYGSVLAYLSRPGDGRCQKTLDLMQKLRAFSDEPLLMQNVEANESLCQELMGTPAP
jgi:tetratricopeptide (TPR) repeat protein